ncbi:MAG: DUF4864 domain-containing protein [Alphaproteobacteria bacterium]
MRIVFVFLFVAGLAAVGAITARAQDNAGQQAVATIIQNQLNAMAAGDRAKAYSYAAPFIQQKFRNPDIFMEMVTRGYAPLIAPQAVEFQRFEASGGRATQAVMLVARDGSAWMATYFMQQMEDGSWRIAGCQLEKLPGGAV